MAPDFDRLARMPWPVASFASSGIRHLSSALACSCSRCADRVREKAAANSDVFCCRCLFGERPRQHEFGLEDGAAAFDPPVESRGHPANDRMPNPPLDIGDDLPATGFVPAPIEVLGDRTKLDDEVAREVFRLNLAALLAP
jgi:hypothetical protein